MDRPAITKPNSEVVLGQLKDFQRNTVEHVFRRLYLDPDSARRFLVADEVGLGKTLVAKGVIAKVVDHLWHQPTINIVYICSNADIARQNVRRLNVSGDVEFKSPDRITLLPQYVENLTKTKLNFIALTPGTSFDLKYATGLKDERVLLYWMLQPMWQLKGVASQNVLQVTAGCESFRDSVQEFDRRKISSHLSRAFSSALVRDNRIRRERGQSTLRIRFNRLCRQLPQTRQWIRTPEETRYEICDVIGELRILLAETCIRALKPDLIILDEFQRFRQLLEADDHEGQLAEKLLTRHNARVLMLSATPYKMYTRGTEGGDEDHYRDFLRTTRFLLDDASSADSLDQTLRKYRHSLYGLAEGEGALTETHRQDLEQHLRQVMVRTERLAASENGDGMLTEVRSSVPLSRSDVEAYLETGQLVEWLEKAAGSPLHHHAEYWKSAPYLLNFMEQYKLKQTFDAAVDGACTGSQNAKELAVWLRNSQHSILSASAMKKLEAIDPANARLRALASDILGCGGGEVWRLLWLPPSAPYYEFTGPFAQPGVKKLTKRLIFSNWKVVPKAISVLLSYEAERQMLQSFETGDAENGSERQRPRRLLNFARNFSGEKERLTGMPVLALLYPSSFFAKHCDPLELARGSLAESRLPSLADLLYLARHRIDQALRPLLRGRPTSGPEDTNWYWAAPILLDAQEWPQETQGWFGYTTLAEDWRGKFLHGDEDSEDSAWHAHVQEAGKILDEASHLGRPPGDLLEVLAKLAVGGPANTALRALARVCETEDLVADEVLRDAAGNIGWALRYQFNLPEVIAMIRGMNRAEPYWQRVLEYCCHGCLQSVLDEYLHILHDAGGVAGQSSDETPMALAAAFSEAVGLRVSQPRIDDIQVSDAGAISLQAQVTRCRFAMRFGDEHAEKQSSRDRKAHVRAAFNSPFWPFVLATTSIGQEGLDFHRYCHAVVHWNLPSNPVDMEQREGRVHRYKGHAIRKNVASRHFADLACVAANADPWQLLFEAAVRASREQHTDLVPFWMYPIEGGATIERHLPLLPLSKEHSLLPELKNALAIYRMVFGQPRQDDLLEYLSRRLPPDELASKFDQLRIDLTPSRKWRENARSEKHLNIGNGRRLPQGTE